MTTNIKNQGTASLLLSSYRFNKFSDTTKLIQGTKKITVLHSLQKVHYFFVFMFFSSHLLQIMSGLAARLFFLFASLPFSHIRKRKKCNRCIVYDCIGFLIIDMEVLHMRFFYLDRESRLFMWICFYLFLYPSLVLSSPKFQQHDIAIFTFITLQQYLTSTYILSSFNILY